MLWLKAVCSRDPCLSHNGILWPPCSPASRMRQTGHLGSWVLWSDVSRRLSLRDGLWEGKCLTRWKDYWWSVWLGSIPSYNYRRDCSCETRMQWPTLLLVWRQRNETLVFGKTNTKCINRTYYSTSNQQYLNYEFTNKIFSWPACRQKARLIISKMIIIYRQTGVIGKLGVNRDTPGKIETNPISAF